MITRRDLTRLIDIFREEPVSVFYDALDGLNISLSEFVKKSGIQGIPSRKKEKF